MKRIVYYDYGGSHTSVTAACIRAGMLKPDQKPNREILMQLPYLDKTTPKDFGRIKRIGTDKEGNEIYALGMKTSNSGNLLNDLVNLQNVSNQYQFIDTSPYVNLVLRIGGWLSRSASLPSIGRPLVISGLKKAYPYLCSLVEIARIKEEGRPA